MVQAPGLDKGERLKQILTLHGTTSSVSAHCLGQKIRLGLVLTTVKTQLFKTLF